MDITRLRYFERVARLASFTRAAEDLHVAQPALSKQIAALEQEIGARLFERVGGHSIILTERGQRLLAHTEAALLPAPSPRVRAEPRQSAYTLLHGSSCDVRMLDRHVPAE
jgi:DNA-binding transcriptional LysR family regulator